MRAVNIIIIIIIIITIITIIIIITYVLIKRPLLAGTMFDRVHYMRRHTSDI